MERTYIKDIKESVGKEVVVKGFVQTIRDQGSIKFLILRDVSGLVQVVVVKSAKEAFELAENLTLESVVEIHGEAKEEAQAPGGVEVKATELIVLSESEPELPIPVVVEKSGGETDITKRLDYRWIDLRRPENLKIFKVWTALEAGLREQLIKDGFVQAYSPSFMNAPSESGADAFEVKYFDKFAYLAQSPQFYKQMALAAGFDKVMMFGPVFRAEPSFTTRHTTEFPGWDFEFSYVDSHHDVMDQEEKAIISAFKAVKETELPDLEIPTQPFPRITMAEAKEKLAKAGIKSDKDYDVNPEEERELSKIIKEETGHDFVFLIDYPIEARPFYHMRHEDNPKLTKSFDLLYRGLEITTGAQREHRVDILEAQAKEKGMSLDSIGFYLDFFRYGCPPHGGCGIGPSRIVMSLLGLASVKEATFLPRDVKRLNP